MNNRSSSASPGAAQSQFQRGSIRLFCVGGIEVLLHWSWFFFALVRLQSGGSDDAFEFVHYESQIWYAVEYVALFAFVLLHEFGHVLACRSVGGISDSIVLWPLGGIALVDPPAQPSALLWSIAAGPLVNLLLLAPTVGFWLACRAAGLEDTAPDVYRLAVALVWINGYLLVFNILPIFPLDGGRILQALLWFVMSRAHSMLAATAFGLLTALGLLAVAIVQRSLVWGIMAGFGALFCLVGFAGARALMRMLAAPRRKEAACPSCGAAPPIGTFWTCTRCWTPFDVFASRGDCPNCSTPLATVLCPECGRARPYVEWHPALIASEASAATHQPVLAEAVTEAPHRRGVHPPTVMQRLVWGTIFAFFALACCGLPKVETEPLGLVVWTAGGAVLGAMSAGAMTRAFRSSQARKKLRGTWRLVEVDGQRIPDGAEQPRQLILNYAAYEEHIGEQREDSGVCWADPLSDPPAISLTPKKGPGAGKPRQGIYRLDGDVLTVCLAHPDRPRPSAFIAQPDLSQWRVYQRDR
jgi:uncharacterized protein (TIGR03067 family)